MIARRNGNGNIMDNGVIVRHYAWFNPDCYATCNSVSSAKWIHSNNLRISGYMTLRGKLSIIPRKPRRHNRTKWTFFVHCWRWTKSSSSLQRPFLVSVCLRRFLKVLT